MVRVGDAVQRGFVGEFPGLILVGSKSDPELGRPAVGRLGASIYVISGSFLGVSFAFTQTRPWTMSDP